MHMKDIILCSMKTFICEHIIYVYVIYQFACFYVVLRHFIYNVVETSIVFTNTRFWLAFKSEDFFLDYKKVLYGLMFWDCYTLLFQILSVHFYLTFTYDSIVCRTWKTKSETNPKIQVQFGSESWAKYLFKIFLDRESMFRFRSYPRLGRVPKVPRMICVY